MEKQTRNKIALRDSVVAVIGVILIAANTRSAVSGLSPIAPSTLAPKPQKP